MINTTRTERALILTMGITIVRRTGEICQEQGYPAPNRVQRTAMFEFIERVLTRTVFGLRESGPDVHSDDISAITDEIAAGAVRRVLGEPPQTATEGLN